MPTFSIIAVVVLSILFTLGVYKQGCKSYKKYNAPQSSSGSKQHKQNSVNRKQSQPTSTANNESNDVNVDQLLVKAMREKMMPAGYDLYDFQTSTGFNAGAVFDTLRSIEVNGTMAANDLKNQENDIEGRASVTIDGVHYESGGGQVHVSNGLFSIDTTLNELPMFDGNAHIDRFVDIAATNFM